LGEKGRRLLLPLLGAAHSLNHSLFLVLPLFLWDVAKEFSSTIDTIGLIAAATGFIYGAGSLVGGSLSDRLGEIKTVTLSLALAGASTIIFFVARDLAVFSLGLLCVGTWASLYHPTANSIISKVFRANMAEAMGLHGTGGNVGYMFAPLITVAMGSLWGWRYPLLFFGLLSILVSILILKLPKVHVERNQGRVRSVDVIKTPGLLTLLTYNVLVGLYFKGVEFIFPTFVQLRFSEFFEKELIATIKGVAVFGIFAAGILGQWLGGKASDSFGSKRALIGTSIGVSLSMFLLLLLVSPQPILGVSVFVLLYGLCFYGHQPALNSLAGLITPGNMRGTMFGILFFFSFGLGSLSTFIAASFARYSLESAFLVLMIFSVVALLLSFFAPSHEKRSKNNETERGESP